MNYFGSVLFALILVSGSAFTQTLKVALMDKRPFMYKEGDKFVGFHYEVANEISNKLGVSLEAFDVPVLRAIEMLKRKEAEITIMTENSELDSLKAKKQFLLKLDTFVYWLKNNKSKSVSEFKGRMARISNSCVAMKEKSDIEWIDVESYEQAYKMLKANRVDSVCGSIAFKIVSKSKEIKSTRVNEKSLWVHAHPEIDKKRWESITKATQALVKSGIVENLAKKYAN